MTAVRLPVRLQSDTTTDVTLGGSQYAVVAWRPASTRSGRTGYLGALCAAVCLVDWRGAESCERRRLVESPAALMPAAQSAHQWRLECSRTLGASLAARDPARRLSCRGSLVYDSPGFAGPLATVGWVSGARSCRCGRAGAAAAAERNDSIQPVGVQDILHGCRCIERL